MLSKIYIVDFEDSFTYNIASTLFDSCDDITVVTHHDFFDKKTFDLILADKKSHAVILGPGPGHPEKYRNYFDQISMLRNKKNIYLLGICLGHQILGLIDGLKVKKARELLHGQNVPIVFKNKSYLVQRYNSLAIYDQKNSRKESSDEVNIRYFENGISYQFHPESVGTESNMVFFQELLDFISN